MLKKILIFMVCTTMVMASACGGFQDASANEKDGEVVANQSEEVGNGEKVLNHSLFWIDPDIDPINGWNGWTLTRTGTGEGLLKFNEDMEMVPVVASAYQQVDDLTTVFTIREGVTFHNGKSVDAAAVKASIERALEHSDREDVKFPVASIEAEGQTLTITTERPFATLLNNLADPVFIIVDAEAAANDENFKFKPITTAAFKVMSFDPEVGLTLEKFEDHWAGVPGVDKVNVKYISDGTARMIALQSGELDIAPQLAPLDLKVIEESGEFNVQKGPNLRIWLYRINHDSPYMKHLEFRQALCYGMDNKTFAEKIAGGVSANGPFNSSLPFAYQGQGTYTYDPEKANALLDALGFMDTDGDGIRECEGENIVLKCVLRSNAAIGVNYTTAMQAQYKDIGVGIEMVQAENTRAMVESGDFDLQMDRWTSAPTGDPQYFMDSSFKTDGPGNFGHYSNSEFDALCAQLALETDQAKRFEIGARADKLMMDDIASLFLYYQEGNIVTSKRVSGVERYMSEVYYIDERVMME
jgi:peptide/nickel transport system substrate-binding protein